jgi:hypothetical protein
MLSWSEFFGYTVFLGTCCTVGFTLLGWALDWWSLALPRRRCSPAGPTAAPLALLASRPARSSATP